MENRFRGTTRAASSCGGRRRKSTAGLGRSASAFLYHLSQRAALRPPGVIAGVPDASIRPGEREAMPGKLGRLEAVGKWRGSHWLAFVFWPLWCSLDATQFNLACDLTAPLAYRGTTSRSGFRLAGGSICWPRTSTCLPRFSNARPTSSTAYPLPSTSLAETVRDSPIASRADMLMRLPLDSNAVSRLSAAAQPAAGAADARDLSMPVVP